MAGHFLVFREESCPEMLCDNNFRVIASDSDEWLELARQRPLSTYPS
jgi:hypothetical protein